LAYGLCEPHGPHNAVGLDALKAHAIAVEAARTHGGIVAPPDYWHVHELGESARWGHVVIGQARTWLTSMPPWQHFKNVCYHVRAADALGFHAVILLTGHYGPWQDLNSSLSPACWGLDSYDGLLKVGKGAGAAIARFLKRHGPGGTRIAYCSKFEAQPFDLYDII